MIELEDCEDGHVYLIDARNANIGIFRKKDLGFIISRVKFNDNFLYTEYHWDVGKVRPEDEQYGTVKPLQDIGVAPEMNDVETLKFLNDLQENKKAEIRILLDNFRKSDRNVAIMNKLKFLSRNHGY